MRLSEKRLLLFGLAVSSVALAVVVSGILRPAPLETPFGSLTIVSTARGATDQTADVAIAEIDAVSAAAAKLSELEPTIADLELADSTLSQDLTRVDEGDNTVFISSDPIAAAWVMRFTAPANDEFSNVTAFAIVDATTGEIHVAAVTQNNE